MIGGRVLDASALLTFAREDSVYAQAFVWTAVGESIVPMIPSTAVAHVWSQLTPSQRAVLDVLLGLHVTVVDPLDGERAREVGVLGGDAAIAHAAICARSRGWAVLTAEPDRYAGLGVTVETLP